MEEIIKVTFNKINGENFQFRVALAVARRGCIYVSLGGWHAASAIDPGDCTPKHPPLTHVLLHFQLTWILT